MIGKKVSYIPIRNIDAARGNPFLSKFAERAYVGLDLWHYHMGRGYKNNANPGTPCTRFSCSVLNEICANVPLKKNVTIIVPQGSGSEFAITYAAGKFAALDAYRDETTASVIAIASKYFDIAVVHQMVYRHKDGNEIVQMLIKPVEVRELGERRRELNLLEKISPTIGKFVREHLAGMCG